MSNFRQAVRENRRSGGEYSSGFLVALNLHVFDVLKSGSPAGDQCCVQWISGDVARSRPGREWFGRSRPSRFEQSVQQLNYRRAAWPKIPLDLDSKSGRIRVEKVDSWALPAVAIGRQAVLLFPGRRLRRFSRRVVVR